MSFCKPIEVGPTYDKADSQKCHPLNIGNPEIRTGTSSCNSREDSPWVAAAEFEIAAMIVVTYRRNYIKRMKNRRDRSTVKLHEFIG
jgi:hypothetical protein